MGKGRIYHDRILKFLAALVVLQYVCMQPINGQSYSDDLKAVSDSLFALGVEKYNSQLFEDAVLLFAECSRIDSAVFDANSSRLGYSLMWLASCHFKLGDVETAASLSDFYMINPIDRRLTVKSDSVSDMIYPILYEYGDWATALPLIREVMSLEKEELGENNVWLGNTYGVYGYAQFLSGNIEEALNAYDRSLYILGTACGENSKPYAYVLGGLVNTYSATGDYDSAYTNACNLLDICKRLGLEGSGTYYAGIATCGGYLFNTGKYDEAESYLSESLEILSKNGMENTLDYAVTQTELGWVHLMAGDVGEAKESLERSYLLFAGLPDDYDKGFLAQCMNYLSQAEYLMGDTVAAITLCKDAIAVFENGETRQNFLYPLLQYNLYNIYESLSKSQEAHAYAEKAIANYRALECKNVNYADLLFKYSKCVSDEGRFSYAIELAEEALSFIEGLPDVADSIRVTYQNRLAYHYWNNADMESAYHYARMSMDEFETAFPRQSMNRIQTIMEMAPALWLGGDKDDALLLYQDALNGIEELMPYSEVHYSALCGLAQMCQMSGLYTDAVDNQKKAVEIAESLYGKNNNNYFDATTNLLSYLGTIGDEGEKKLLISQLGANISHSGGGRFQEIRQEVFLMVQQGNLIGAEPKLIAACSELEGDSTHLLDYAFLHLLKAEVQCNLGRYNEALSSLEIGRGVMLDLFGAEKFDKYYYNYWNLRGMAYVNLRRWDDAEEAFNNSTAAAKTVFGDEHMEALLPRALLSFVKLQQGDAEESARIMSVLFREIREKVFTCFATMSSSERTVFWSQISTVFNPMMPYMAYVSKIPRFYGDGYNALLLSKGLLLNTETEVTQILKQSNDVQAIEMLNKVMQAHQRINNLVANPSAIAEIDSLREVIKKGERDLMARSSAYGDYTKSLRVTWEDVRNRLDDSDVAVEFADFYDNDGANLYVAFVLKKDMAEPQIVRLFDYSDFSSIDSYDYYRSNSLYKLVWEPLEPFFSAGAKIYFSPQGVLHSVAIESLPAEDGVPVSERYSTYRLSSTRELCLNEGSGSRENKAALYGGIDYNVNHIIKADNSPDDGKVDSKRMIGEFRGAIRDDLRMLPGTAVEVDSIAALFSRFNCYKKVFTKADATEESVKSLFESEYTILHLATHGYYLSAGDTRSTFLPQLVQSFGLNQEDMSLARSGLFLAGANATLFDNSFQYFQNDGILTANEVAKMDMRKYELVSLSACKTGLGDVSGDGVFGLQRGFKKAGTKAILMSLWDVDDKATCKLMMEFYKNWLEGTSKHKALELAKTAVRSTKGWEDPIFWAGFILLDGL